MGEILDGRTRPNGTLGAQKSNQPLVQGMSRLVQRDIDSMGERHVGDVEIA